MEDLQYILLCMCGLPAMALLIIFGPPVIVALASFSSRLQRMANRHRRIALSSLILFGFISFMWVHVAVGRIGATTSRVLYEVGDRMAGGFRGLDPNLYDPIPDELHQAVETELWIRWILPFSSPARCYSGIVAACTTLDEISRRSSYVELEPLPAIGIISGMISGILLVAIAKRRLIGDDSVVSPMNRSGT
jgi:hypothetical protein